MKYTRTVASYILRTKISITNRLYIHKEYLKTLMKVYPNKTDTSDNNNAFVSNCVNEYKIFIFEYSSYA